MTVILTTLCFVIAVAFTLGLTTFIYDVLLRKRK